MKLRAVYKNYLIVGESFQREKNGNWVSQYSLTRAEGAGNANDFPSHQYQLNAIFQTERDADEYAVQRAQQWIDQN